MLCMTLMPSQMTKIRTLRLREWASRSEPVSHLSLRISLLATTLACKDLSSSKVRLSLLIKSVWDRSMIGAMIAQTIVRYSDSLLSHSQVCPITMTCRHSTWTLSTALATFLTSCLRSTPHWVSIIMRVVSMVPRPQDLWELAWNNLSNWTIT